MFVHTYTHSKTLGNVASCLVVDGAWRLVLSEQFVKGDLVFRRLCVFSIPCLGLTDLRNIAGEGARALAVLYRRRRKEGIKSCHSLYAIATIITQMSFVGTHTPHITHVWT